MEQAVPPQSRGRNKDAQQQIEAHLAAHGAGDVDVPTVARFTGLPQPLVSTILGRMARYGSELTRTGHARAGTFHYQPSHHAKVRALPPAAPAARNRPAPVRHRTRCPDSDLVAVTDRPTQDGSWVFYGNQTGKPYRVVPL